MIIVKRNGHEEIFKKEKVYNTIYESCLNAHHNTKTASNIAKKVTDEVVKDLKGKKRAKTDYVFKIISTLLEKYDQDAAFLYETHRDIS